MAKVEATLSIGGVVVRETHKIKSFTIYSPVAEDGNYDETRYFVHTHSKEVAFVLQITTGMGQGQGYVESLLVDGVAA